MRDPRQDPIPGDVIKQRKSGMLVKCLERSGDSVAFREIGKKNDGKIVHWTVKGWANMVANDSEIFEQGPDHPK